MFHSPTSCIPPGFASHALQLLQRVQQGISPVELVYTSHERWPLRPRCTTHSRPTLCISVLDSSFNPPTLAHLALANSLPPWLTQHPSPGSAASEAYDAQLLLLSVRNADKTLKSGDATFVQRLEMMHLLSQDIRPTGGSGTGRESGTPQSSRNVALAIIDEPTFVGKSTVLLRFLRSRLRANIEVTSHDETVDVLPPIPSPKLSFLLGFDTFARLFATKYYPSKQSMIQMLRSLLAPDQEDCRIVCAHRQTTSGVEQSDQSRILEIADEFITNGRISFIDIGEDEQTFSSSEVRVSVAAKDETWKRLVSGAIVNYILERGLYAEET